MRIKSRVAKFSGDRKIVEIPQSARDNFVVGERVVIIKEKGDKK